MKNITTISMINLNMGTFDPVNVTDIKLFYSRQAFNLSVIEETKIFFQDKKNSTLSQTHSFFIKNS